MSATLRVSDFADNTTLFSSPPPIINVPARQHPVTVHFSRRTTSDYITEAVKKASKIHARLPPGGILIFLTGQNEITGVCRKLEARYSKKSLEERKKSRQSLQSRLSKLATKLGEDDPPSRIVTLTHGKSSIHLSVVPHPDDVSSRRRGGRPRPWRFATR